MKKVRHRYLALKIDSDVAFSSREFMDALWGAILKLYGEYGASKSNLTLISYNCEGKLAVVRVTYTEVDMIRAALASITKIRDSLTAVHVLKVSGTLRALRKKVEGGS